ncbi:MAG: GFA family protein [Hyphomicrobiales bacterium]
MKIDGQCHCGHISFEAELDPEKVGICHCTDCQNMSGSAFRTLAIVDAATFQLLSGEPKTYTKTGDSGNRRLQTFCPECGTPIYAGAAEEHPKILNVRLGTVRQREQFVPKVQYWTRSAQHWLGDIPEITKHDKQ